MPVRALLALLALLPACAPDDSDPGPDVDCSAVDVPKFSEMTAWARCTGCHTAAVDDPVLRGGAPVGVDFDELGAARVWAAAAMDEVYAGTMPPATEPQPTAAEKQQIYDWASCDTPN
jgi:uncharacterized membrane protein